MGTLKNVEIDSAKFPDLDVNCLYNVVGGVKTQLFIFFDSVADQQANYFLTGNLVNKLDLAELNFYERFGIYSEHSSLINDDKEYLLILEEPDLVDEDTLKSAVAREKNRFECTTFNCAVIKKRYKDIAELERDSSLLFGFLPNIHVFNRGFQNYEPDLTEQKLRLDGKCQYVNMADFFKDLVFDSFVPALNMQNVLKVYKRMLEYRNKPVVFYCNDTNPKGTTNQKICQGVVTAMAAFLTLKYGFVFEFSRSRQSDYLRYARDLVSKNYNYLSDFLKIIMDPLDVGFKLIENRMYLMILDSTTMQKQKNVYDVKLDMLCLPFDAEHHIIKDATVVRRLSTAENVKCHSLDNCFNLGSSRWSAAREGMKELNLLFNQAEQMIKASEFGLTEPLTITNVLIIEDDGEFWLAYVHHISGKVRYVATDIAGGMTAFPVDIPIEELNQVYDLRMLEDRTLVQKLIKKAGWGSGEFKTYQLGSAARGIIFRSLPIEVSLLGDNCGATTEELGIWNATCCQLRANKAQSVLNAISLKAARESQLFTCFGGPHPGLCVNITLGTDGRR